MKKSLYAVFMLLAVLCSCSNDSVEYEYLPCQVEDGEGWGFVSSKGKVYLQDNFSSCPTPVVEGVFFVQEGSSYSMYEFDKKNPKLLRDGLISFGLPHDGLVPICEENSCIEVVDMDGETEFELCTVDGQKVVKCAPRLVDDMLKVYSVDKNGKKYCSVVDDDGDVVISPKYTDIHIISDELFFVTYMDGEQQVHMFLDDDEDEVSAWPEVDNVYCSSDKYVAVSRHGRCCIYTYKGKEVLKCPEKVRAIANIQGKSFIYLAENGSYGVMNVRGEQILMSRYCSIQQMENGKFLARKDADCPYELLSKRGEKLETLSDYDEVYYVEGFGVVAADGGYFYVLNRKYKPAGKMEYANIDYDGFSFTFIDVLSDKY